MGILMAGLSTHPPLIIPEIGGKERMKIKETINSLEELAGEVKSKEPDLLITISPHGPVFRDAISTPDQAKLFGDFGDFGQPGVSYEADNNLKFIRKLSKNAREEEIEVITLSEENDYMNSSSQLDHGVLIPLHFLRKVGLQEVPVVALTMGLLPYEKLYDFGLLIKKSLQDLEIDAVIIASGDLSHRLKPGAPAGFNPRGKEFDREIIDILKTKDFERSLNIDPLLIKKAGECGLRPLIIMLGALRGYEVETDVKSYEGPFGVGYGVAGIYPK